MESNKFPLISVGLITYNHEKYIEDCLKSILLQDYPYMELIILDDASTDNNVQIIENYLPELNNKFERVQFIKHKINSANIPKNYNEIESHIKGEFFFGVSGDDIIFADSITKLYNCFTRHQECCLIYANGFYIDDDFHLGDNIDLSKVLIKNKDVSNEENISFKKLMYGNTICRPTVLIPSKIIKKYGSHDETLIYEDYEYWIRLLSNDEKFYFLNEPVVLYRKAENSCTNFNSKDIINNMNKFKVNMEHEYLCKKKYLHLLNKTEQQKVWELYYKYYVITLPKRGYNELIPFLDSLLKNIDHNIYNDYQKFKIMINRENHIKNIPNILNYKCDNIIKNLKKKIRQENPTIAIYGFSNIGELLLKKLTEFNIKVKYIIDRKGNKIKTSLQVYKPTDNFPIIDCIIIAPLGIFDEVYPLIQDKAPYILDLEDIAFTE